MPWQLYPRKIIAIPNVYLIQCGRFGKEKNLAAAWIFCTSLSWLCRLSLSVQHTQHKHPFPGARFEPVTPVSDRPQTLALDRPATGIRTPYHTAHSLMAIRTELLRLHLLQYHALPSPSVNSSLHGHTPCRLFHYG